MPPPTKPSMNIMQHEIRQTLLPSKCELSGHTTFTMSYFADACAQLLAFFCISSAFWILSILCLGSQLRVTTIWTWCRSVFSPLMNSFCPAGVLTKRVSNCFSCFYVASMMEPLTSQAEPQSYVRSYSLSWTFLLARSHSSSSTRS